MVASIASEEAKKGDAKKCATERKRSGSHCSHSSHGARDEECHGNSHGHGHGHGHGHSFVEPHGKEDIPKLLKVLNDKSELIGKRIEVVFALKHIGGEAAIDALVDGMDRAKDSVLLSHEIAYVLGQMQDPYANPFLVRVLEDKDRDPTVRHEAAESLGAIGTPASLKVLRKWVSSPVRAVRETCQLAIETIEWRQKQAKAKGPTGGYLSVDPAPPEEKKQLTSRELGERLRDESLSLFLRYKAMFALRDRGDDGSCSELTKAFSDSSALVRHEIAYVLGQCQNPSTIPALAEVLSNRSEHEMVRHEAAEAIGSIGGDKAEKILSGFVKDPNKIVRESCLVALDIADSWTGGGEAVTEVLSPAKTGEAPPAEAAAA